MALKTEKPHKLQGNLWRDRMSRCRYASGIAACRHAESLRRKLFINVCARSARPAAMRQGLEERRSRSGAK